MYGAVDVVPMAFVMLGLWLLFKKQALLSGLALAAGIAIKLFPIIALPVFLCSGWSGGSKARKSIKIILMAGLAILALWAYVDWSMFPVSADYYTQSTTELILSPQSFTGFSPPIDFIGLATLSVVFLYAFIGFRYPQAFRHSALEVALLITLAYVCFLDIQIEYILWVIPFFAIVNLVHRRTVLPYIGILVSAFSLGFVTTGGFLTQSGWSLLFFNPAIGWANYVLSSPLVDIVLRPILRTFISVFIIICMIMIWSSTIIRPSSEARTSPTANIELKAEESLTS